jgi:hypothetical protein
VQVLQTHQLSAERRRLSNANFDNPIGRCLYFYFLLQVNDRVDWITRSYLLSPRFLPMDTVDFKIF